MLRWLGTNLRSFFWAFLMALTVWVAAVNASDPDEERLYPDPIPIEIVGQSPGMIITGDYPESIQITLRAPSSVWEKLLSGEGENIRAIIDLSGLDEGRHDLPIQVQIETQPVRIVSVTPENATINLEALISKSFPLTLTLAGEPAVGYRAGDAVISPEEIIVSGPKSSVEQVDRVRVLVNLAGIRESIDQSLTVQALDQTNQIVSNISLSPEDALVKIPVSQQGGYRDLAVKVVVQGQVANGYRLTNISVFPPVVTVFSTDSALVNELPGVLETIPLEFENANEDISTRLSIPLPEGVSLVGEQTVLVQVGISAIQSSLPISDKTIEVEGLEDGWSIQLAPATVDVILAGPLPLLDTLSPQDVQVIIDVSGLEEGTYQLEPEVRILFSEISVESILPGTIEVTLTKGDQGTPSPTPTPAP
jgi:YbbR domain-containing protein